MITTRPFEIVALTLCYRCSACRMPVNLAVYKQSNILVNKLWEISSEFVFCSGHKAGVDVGISLASNECSRIRLDSMKIT